VHVDQRGHLPRHPRRPPAADGDIVNIDVTVFLDGVHGDTSSMWAVGEVDQASTDLIRVTREAMFLGIDAVAPGRPVNVIGRAIEDHARAHGLGVVRAFIGHGIGEAFHTGLQIPHGYEPTATTTLLPGMTFTVEPMLTLGNPDHVLWEDGWTAVTADRSRSAQFEHTVVVTEEGAELLTVAVDGGSPPVPGSVSPPPDPATAPEVARCATSCGSAALPPRARRRWRPVWRGPTGSACTARTPGPGATGLVPWRRGIRQRSGGTRSARPAAGRG
jgi:hypothetical protein